MRAFLLIVLFGLVQHGATEAPAAVAEAAPSATTAPVEEALKTSAAEAETEKPTVPDSEAPQPISSDQDDPHKHGDWSYDEAGTAPAVWGSLRSDYHQCSVGRQQSPINIISDDAEINNGGSMKPLLFNYRAIQTDEKTGIIRNDGRGFIAKYHVGSTFQTTLHGEIYDLSFFTFHSPSEHQVNGKSYPMEMQIVHKSSAGNLAVVSLFFELGGENEFLNSLHWDELPAKGGQGGNNVLVNVAQALPFELHYWHYQGSLTIPPCTESVLWYILQQPVMLSQKQLERFTSALKSGNVRPLQPLNNRKIFSSKLTRDLFGKKNVTPAEQAQPQQAPPVISYVTPEIREPKPEKPPAVPTDIIPVDGEQSSVLLPGQFPEDQVIPEFRDRPVVPVDGQVQGEVQGQVQAPAQASVQAQLHTIPAMALIQRLKSTIKQI